MNSNLRVLTSYSVEALVGLYVNSNAFFSASSIIVLSDVLVKEFDSCASDQYTLPSLLILILTATLAGVVVKLSKLGTFFIFLLEPSPTPSPFPKPSPPPVPPSDPPSPSPPSSPPPEPKTLPKSYLASCSSASPFPSELLAFVCDSAVTADSSSCVATSSSELSLVSSFCSLALCEVSLPSPCFRLQIHRQHP